MTYLNYDNKMLQNYYLLNERKEQTTVYMLCQMSKNINS